MKKLRWPAISMIIAILAITGFQGYWLKNNYDREKQNLDIKTNAAFRQTILRLQSSKLKLERISYQLDSAEVSQVIVGGKKKDQKRFDRFLQRKEPSITLLNLLQEKMRDSLEKHSGKNFRGDTLSAKMKMTISSLDISRTIDSVLDPEMIREVNLQRAKRSPESVITIAVGPKNSGKKENESIELENKGNIYIKNHSDGADQEILMGNNGIGLPPSQGNAVFRFLYNVDSLSARDSVTVKEITDAYTSRLKEDNINIAFKVNRLDSTQAGTPNAVTIGFTKPAVFALSLQSIFGYMLGKLKLPILFSLLLLGVTIASFVLLYRNMIKQQRLAELKNEFISNITHELKTPIATVSVAIEALKNFNAIDDPQRTREYLDISQNELQRLNLLVDKVLKLSIFEKKAIELKKEVFDLRQLAEEVMNSMKLQFEKYGTKLNFVTEGDNFSIDADKLHITSVIYNLLDNALKYSKENPEVTVKLKSHTQHVSLSVKDNGIGIPSEYKGKIFEKFFRVPTGDKHNIKGYGLGLSYVSEIARRHQGFIEVESELGKGSIFTVNIPYKEASVIQFDEHRKIVKKQIRSGH